MIIINQGCGVGVQATVGVGRSRLFWPESESHLESAKFADSDSDTESPTDKQYTVVVTNDNKYIRPKTKDEKRLRKKMSLARRMQVQTY